MVELKNYLSTIDPGDREAALRRYEAIFDEAGEENTDEVLARLGSPAKAAITVKRELDGRAPMPAERPSEPEAVEAPREDPEPEGGSPKAADKDGSEPEPDEDRDTPPAAPEKEPDPEEGPAEQGLSPDEPAPPAPERRVRPVLLALYVIPAVIIGIPLVILALALSIAFFAAGGAVLAGGVQVFLLGFSIVGLIADSLFLFGGGLILLAVGLPVVWFAVWLCISSMKGIVGGILSLGRRVYCKEVRAV